MEHEQNANHKTSKQRKAKKEFISRRMCLWLSINGMHTYLNNIEHSNIKHSCGFWTLFLFIFLWVLANHHIKQTNIEETEYF